MKFQTLILTTALLCGTHQIASAATVDISASGSDSWNKTVVGTYIKNTKIKFSEAGTYSISLQDTDFGANFEMLGAMISSPSTKYVDLVLSADESANARQFKIDKAGDYFLNVFAITDSIRNPATFSLAVNAVPLPSAVIFMSSALMGLVAFMRRRTFNGQV
ncbi:MAG: hypothetical protein RL497_1528 [Pseudomonadota bacterium]|jgi:hypothetical protein